MTRTMRTAWDVWVQTRAYDGEVAPFLVEMFSS